MLCSLSPTHIFSAFFQVKSWLKLNIGKKNGAKKGHCQAYYSSSNRPYILAALGVCAPTSLQSWSQRHVPKCDHDQHHRFHNHRSPRRLQKEDDGKKKEKRKFKGIKESSKFYSESMDRHKWQKRIPRRRRECMCISVYNVCVDADQVVVTKNHRKRRKKSQSWVFVLLIVIEVFFSPSSYASSWIFLCAYMYVMPKRCVHTFFQKRREKNCPKALYL